MIHLYAEHLLNIHTLSIQAVLSTVSNKETKATLLANKSILTLTHEGEIASIKLPISLSPSRQSTVELTLPAIPSRDLSFRLELEEKEGATNGVLSKDAPSSEGGNIIPWTAAILNSETEIHCHSCDSILVRTGKVKEWKDLPSAGWAEMMDFWHCHKPHEPENGRDHAESTKGYAAGSQLALKPSVAMVGVMDFLFDENDCTNIAVDDERFGLCLLNCTQCFETVGQLDHLSQGYRISKSEVTILESADGLTRTFTLEKWFACLFLSAAENQGVRKFEVRAGNSDLNQALKVWLFTPDLLISSSVKSSTDYIRVCKIMWQESEANSDSSAKLNGSALSEGELTLRADELHSLKEILEASCKVLPEGSRKFQDWHVAVLEKFTQSDVN